MTHPRIDRRWVVERTLAWLSACRGIRWIREEDIHYLGLIRLGCALFLVSRLYRLGRCTANRLPHEHPERSRIVS